MPENSSFYHPIVDSFFRMGIDSQLFDNRRTVFYEKAIFVLSKIIPSFYILGTKLLNRRLIWKVKKYKPDLVLVIKGENIFPETVEEIKKRYDIVNYFSDYFRWFGDEKMTGWIKAYPVMYTGDPYDVNRFKKKGFKNLFYIPLAGPIIKEFFKRRKYNVVFVGAYSKDREERFKDLKRFGLRIWGDQKWKSSSLADCFMNKWLSADETLEVFKNAKIVVNYHNFTKKNRYVNLRVFEATSCNSLLITDNRPDLADFFVDGREIVIYKNTGDLFEKVGYYLKNESKRLDIANQGYKRLLRDHTFDLRLKEMFKIVDVWLSKNKSI